MNRSTAWIAPVLSVLPCALCIAFENAAAIESAPTIAYPKRVQIPDELPSMALVPKDTTGDERYVILPPALYLYGHYRGWQKCLKECGLELIPEDKPPAYKTNEPYANLGERRGYNDCVRTLQQFLKTGMTRAELVTLCKASYLPLREDLPPKPAPAGDAPIKSPF